MCTKRSREGTHVHVEGRGGGCAHVREEGKEVHACARGQKFKRKDKGDGGQLSSVDTGAVE